MPRTADERAELGRFLTDARREAGYRSIADLANAVEISSKTIGNAEAGRKVSETTIATLRDFLQRAKRERVRRDPEVGSGVIVDAGRYGEAAASLDAWLKRQDEDEARPPTSALWLWSSKQLATALQEQVSVLEAALDDQMAESFRQYRDQADLLEGRGTSGEEGGDRVPATTTDAEVTSATDLNRRRRGRVSDPAPTVREDVAAMDDDTLLKEREAQQEQP